MHFGRCASFALVEVDDQTKKILGREDIPAPPHEPGLLPPWLAQQGIQVVVGAPPEAPEKLIADFFTGTLQTGVNACDH